MSEPYVIGCDIGVTHVKVVTVSREGEVLSRRQVDTLADRPDWPTRVRDVIAATEQAYGPAAHVGLAAPGIAAPHGRFIAWMRGRLAEVEGLDWSERLGRPVPVLNDAQAALLGEVWQGAARGARNVMLLTLGTGVGGALMVDGRLLRGHLGRAGHLGHISLDPDGPPDIVNTPGSLEDAIGNCTVARRSGGRFATTHDLYAAHERGDAMATELWNRSIKALGAGVASLINVADPEVVIIGGGIARASGALFAPLEALLDQFEWRPHGRRVRIVPAALGEHAGALGAAWNAIDTPRG
jgi:glucokinase